MKQAFYALSLAILVSSIAMHPSQQPEKPFSFATPFACIGPVSLGFSGWQV